MLVGTEVNYPVFISFPRTGSHWINCLAELYFDRPRLRHARVSLLPDRSRTDYMWIHDHDDLCQQPVLPHKNVIYLYRNPVATVYSNLMYSQFEAHKTADVYQNLDFCEQAVESLALRYRSNLLKWLTNPQFHAKTVIRYERAVADPMSALRQFVDHFSVVWQPAKALELIQFVTKERLASAEDAYAPALNLGLVSELYRNNRIIFEQKWAPLINQLVVTDALQPFFSDLRPIDNSTHNSPVTSP